MGKDKFKIYALELVLLITLFFTLFVSNIFTKIALSILLAIYTLVIYKELKKRNIVSMYEKQVTVLMLLFGIIYLMVFYLMGLYFGYYKALVQLSLWSIINYIIPITIIIISSEIIRSVFLAQKGKISKIIIFISMILLDLIIYNNIYEIKTLESLLGIVGYTFFSSIACNLLYNYISTRFGNKPIIVYRLITVLYAYIIPIIPNVYIFFRSFLRIVYPYIIFLILEASYSKTTFVASRNDRRKNIVNTAILLTVSTLIIMLISCQFKYGILVIGSGSMSGAINKGDAVVFESYDGQGEIQEGQVIIFEKDKNKVVHRVVDIKLVNGEYRYYTKGDANQKIDEGYVTKEQITGISKFRILYIGYPTIWIRDIFS